MSQIRATMVLLRATYSGTEQWLMLCEFTLHVLICPFCWQLQIYAKYSRTMVTYTKWWKGLPYLIYFISKMISKASNSILRERYTSWLPCFTKNYPDCHLRNRIVCHIADIKTSNLMPDLMPNAMPCTMPNTIPNTIPMTRPNTIQNQLRYLLLSM